MKTEIDKFDLIVSVLMGLAIPILIGIMIYVVLDHKNNKPIEVNRITFKNNSETIDIDFISSSDKTIEINDTDYEIISPVCKDGFTFECNTYKENRKKCKCEEVVKFSGSAGDLLLKKYTKHIEPETYKSLDQVMKLSNYPKGNTSSDPLLMTYLETKNNYHRFLLQMKSDDTFNISWLEKDINKWHDLNIDQHIDETRLPK